LQKETDCIRVRFVPQLTTEETTMPMIDVTLPEGALSSDARDALAERLTTTLLHWEGAGELPFARQIAWVYFDERPEGSVYVAGEPAAQARYRVLVTIPEGAIKEDERKAGLVAEITREILAAEGAEGDDQAMRVWVFIHEVPDGHWGGAGRIFRLRDIAKLVGTNGASAGIEQPTAA
jgi:phenylpyruvate tautomerase PptA (4-oxalocrotonate tautomerase family)